MSIYLLEIDHYNPVTSQLETLYVSDKGYVDPLTGRGYEKRIAKGGNAQFGTSAYSRGATLGRSTVGDGDLTLSNIDRALDGLRTHDFRAVRISVIQNQRSLLSSAIRVATLSIETVDITWSSLKITLVDRLSELNIQAQRAVFLGNNANAFSIEGNTQLQGQIKPALIGKVGWFEPPLVNSASLLYLIHHNALGVPATVNSIDGVKDSGVTIVFHQNYATIAALITAQQGGSITAGRYGTCLAEGAFCLGSIPVGAVTCQASQAASNIITAATTHLLTEYGGVAGADIENAASLPTWNVGYWINDNISLLDVAQTLCGSGGGWIVPTIEGKLRFGQLINPTSETPLATFLGTDIFKGSSGGLERIAFSDVTGGIPTYNVNVKYQRFSRALSDSEMAGSVSLAERQELAQNYRAVAANDDAIRAIYLQSEPLIIETALFEKANAVTFAAEQLLLRKLWRDLYVIDVDDSNQVYNIGDIIAIKVQGFDLASGKSFIVIGTQQDYNNRIMTYYLYG